MVAVRWKIFTGAPCEVKIVYWGTTTDYWPTYRPHLCHTEAGQDFLTVELSQLNIISLSGMEQNNILFIFKQTKFF